MRVSLNSEFLQQLIKSRGGVSAFLKQWNAVSTKADDHPNNSTIYRWINGQTVPQSGDLYLRLAGLLDVDPFALLAAPDGEIVAAADDLLRMVQHTAAVPSWLQFVLSFFGRQAAWPPEDLSSRYFNRSWHVAEFTHAATTKTNFYATVSLHQAGTGAAAPQVFHFAYRHPSLFHARWLQYGLVRANNNVIDLHHIGGHSDQIQRTDLEVPIRVETWFGQGPALFRVASLHPFTHVLDDSGIGSIKLRFPA